MGWVLEDGWRKRWLARIILHCSGRKDLVDLASIDSFHRAPPRNWNSAGYHFVIKKDGTVEIGRPLKTIGAHALGYNRDSIGICLIGQDGLFTVAQMKAAKGLVSQLCWDYEIPWSEVRCHHEFNDQKTCPDFKRQDFLALLRSGL